MPEPGPELSQLVEDGGACLVSGIEDRPVELYLKASRGDFDQLPDTAIDDLSVQVFYRPCWLSAPAAP